MGISGAVGLAAGGAIQKLWVDDPNPRRNWTLPHPHDLNLPGVWHAGFFICMCGLLSALACQAVRRLASADSRIVDDLARSGWLAGVVFCGAGFLGLAAVDDVAAASTQAGRATAAGLAAAGLGLAAGVAWAARRSGVAGLRTVGCGILAAVGLCALTAYGLPHFSVALRLVAVVICLAVSAALAAARVVRSKWEGAQVAAAAALLTIGVTGLGLQLVEREGAVTAALAVAIGILAAAIARPTRQEISETVLTAVAVAYTVGLLMLTGWLRGPRSGTEANLALGFSSFFLDGLVIGLIRDRFQEVITSNKRLSSRFEEIRRERERGQTATQVGAEVFTQVVGYGLAAVAALITLYVAAARYLGVDRGAGSPSAHLGRLVAAYALAVVLALCAAAAAGRAQPGTTRFPPGPTLRVRPTAGIVASAALVVWIVALATTLNPSAHYILPAAIGALGLGVLSNEDFLRTCARLHLHRPGFWGRSIAALAGLAMAAATFWVLDVALWSHSRPSSSGPAAAGLFALVATVALVVISGVPLARGLRTRRLTPQGPVANLALVQAMYAGLALLALVIPEFVIARIAVFNPPNPGLVAVSAIAIVPSLIGAFIWILHNNQTHLRDQVEDVPAGLGDFEPAEGAKRERGNHGFLDSERLRWLACHVSFQNRASVGLLVLGGAWMSVQLVH